MAISTKCKNPVARILWTHVGLSLGKQEILSTYKSNSTMQQTIRKSKFKSNSMRFIYYPILKIKFLMGWIRHPNMTPLLAYVRDAGALCNVIYNIHQERVPRNHNIRQVLNLLSGFKRDTMDCGVTET